MFVLLFDNQNDGNLFLFVKGISQKTNTIDYQLTYYVKWICNILIFKIKKILNTKNVNMHLK